jgi:hypothetical protein
MGVDRTKCDTVCQATSDSLTVFSHRYLSPGCLLKLIWYVHQRGITATLRRIGSRVAKVCHPGRRKESTGTPTAGRAPEVLHLRPGEIVQVKSEAEIRATLDAEGRHRGLLWMPEMVVFCGGRYRVFQRVERIMLESSGQLRQVENTVLLEGVMCRDLYDCDRSCFHFWREAWLRRMPE